MKKINKLLLKSYVGPLLFAFFMGLFVLLLQFLWKYMDELVGKGLDFITIFEFMFYACWTFVPMALPLAVLLSSLMLFGNLGEHYELVALKAAGIPLKQSMRPLILVCLAVCGVAFFFSNYGVPKAHLNFKKTYYEIRTKKPAVSIPEGVYYDMIEGYSIKIGKKLDDKGNLENIQIYDHRNGRGNTMLTMANRGNMFSTEDGKKLVFNLYDGYSYGEDMERGGASRRRSSDSDNPFTRIEFEKQTLIFDLTSFEKNDAGDDMFKKHYQTLGLKSLENEMDTLRIYLDRRLKDIYTAVGSKNYYLHTYYATDSTKSAARLNLSEYDKYDYSSAATSAENGIRDMSYYRSDIIHKRNTWHIYNVEWHKKFSLSIACLVLFFIGAPLGSIIRKGGIGMPAVAAVILFVFYYVLTVVGEKSAIEGAVSSAQGTWLAVLVFLPLGIFLTLQASVDASFLDIDFWKKLFTKKK